MPTVIIERILSVSSEDLAYPASNLLSSDNNKKWKCKFGEKQASVVLQLKQEVTIEEIDIGNENSAFVEILVGKASTPNEYKVLVIASSLMTLKEAKDGTNPNGVRFFKKDQFLSPATSEKWDRVKIVCTQPFNKHAQYGLSFVVMRSAQENGGGAGPSGLLGRFALKQEDDEQPSVGNWFAKRKDPLPPVPPGAAAAIRDASTPLGIAQGKNKKPTPKRPKNKTPNTPGPTKPTTNDGDKQAVKPNTPQPLVPKPQTNATPFNIRLGDDDSPADDTDADSTYSPTKDKTSKMTDDDDVTGDSDEDSPIKAKRPKKTKKDPVRKTGDTPNGKTPKRKPADAGGGAAKVAKRDVETRPFSRLMEGVTIVISGYQNPLRAELRSKACSMGAKYKADWDPTCTHLICAFVNTPKFNQVRGRGKIVKKEWVEESHLRRKRLPWRRYCLDRNDVGTSSEEEVWEEGSIPSASNSNTTITTIASGINRRRVSDSSGSDTEEEIERVRARQKATPQSTKKPPTPGKLKKSPKKTKKEEVTKDVANIKEEVTKVVANIKNDPYDDETDVESENECSTANLPLPLLPDIFENIVFNIACDIEEDERKQLVRYITAYKGFVADELDGSVEYVLTKSSDVAAEVGEEFGIMCVSPDWIWECSDEQSLVPVDRFTL